MLILDLNATWLESEPRTPLVCILSIGSDPTSQIATLAKNKSIRLYQLQKFKFYHLIGNKRNLINMNSMKLQHWKWYRWDKVKNCMHEKWWWTRWLPAVGYYCRMFICRCHFVRKSLIFWSKRSTWTKPLDYGSPLKCMKNSPLVFYKWP